MLARELCYLIRNSRVVLTPEDIRECCLFISKLCREAGCLEPSDLCDKASQAILRNEGEEEYLSICEKSCYKCGESRRIKPEPARPPLYIT
jgi:hypothetical protein